MMKRLLTLAIFFLALVSMGGCSAATKAGQPGADSKSKPVEIPPFQTEGGSCAWKAAASCDNAALQECLAKEKADIKMTDAAGRNLLHYAAGSLAKYDYETQYACLYPVAYLAVQGVDVNAKDAIGATPLHYASYAGFDIAVAYLVTRQGADTNASDKMGKLPADYVFLSSKGGMPADELKTRKNIADFFNVFKKKGSVSIAFSQEIRMSAIEGSAFYQVTNYEKSITSFTKAIDDFKLDPKGFTPDANPTFHYMRGLAYYQNGDCKSALPDIEFFQSNNTAQANGVKPNNELASMIKVANLVLTQCRNPITATLIYLQKDSEKKATATPTAGVTGRDVLTSTEVPMAACTPALASSCDYRSLINCGDQLPSDTIDPASGQTLLHLAAGAFDGKHSEVSCLASAAYLIMRGADGNTKDKKGATPLHYASQSGSSLITMYLIDHGANYNLKDQAGLTPLDYARRKYEQSSSAWDKNVLKYLEGKTGTGVLVPLMLYGQKDLAEGIVYLEQKNFDKATASFTAVIDTCKADESCQQNASIFAYLYRGNIHFLKGDCQAAKTDLMSFNTLYDKITQKVVPDEALKAFHTAAQVALEKCGIKQ